jgi:hypothetical protein
MTNLGDPIVVYGAVVECEGRGHQHEHTLTFLTDGHRTYAFGPDFDCAVSREGTVFTIECGQAVKAYLGGFCNGWAKVDVSKPPPWGTGWQSPTPEMLELLDKHGERVDEA